MRSHDDQEYGRECGCVRAKRAEELFQTSRITPDLRRKTFETFKVDGKPAEIVDMLRCALDYSRRFRSLTENNWLVFCGEPGAGKTHLNMAVCNKLLDEIVPVTYFQHMDGMDELRESISKGRMAEVLSEVKRVDILCWDDLLKGWNGDPNDFGLRTAMDVFYYRYVNCLPTLISTEMCPEDLLRIDKGWGSRIIERAEGHLVTVKGLQLNYRLRHSMGGGHV